MRATIFSDVGACCNMLPAHCIDWIWSASEPFLYINKQGPQCSNKAPSRWSARVRYACNIFLDLAIMVSARRGANQWILNFLVVLKVIIKRHYLLCSSSASCFSFRIPECTATQEYPIAVLVHWRFALTKHPCVPSDRALAPSRLPLLRACSHKRNG